MSRFLNEKLSGLVAYTPGEQPQDKKYIKLNTNLKNPVIYIKLRILNKISKNVPKYNL